MLHGGFPSHSDDLLEQLYELLYICHKDLQLDPSSCLVAAGMMTGALHNGIHRHNPAMQWPFQQYSGSIHWLRRLEAGNATAADKALLSDSTYSSRYPAGLSSSWNHTTLRLHHPFHPHVAWVCPAPLYLPPGNILEIVQASTLPNLNTQMVTGWEVSPEYDPRGVLLGLKLVTQVVDIHNPAGPACDGCQPYTLEVKQADPSCEGHVAAASAQQQGKQTCQGRGSDPGRAGDIPGYRRRHFAGDNVYTRAPQTAPWYLTAWPTEYWFEVRILAVCVALCAVWLVWQQ
jgi:hypothetical protein